MKRLLNALKLLHTQQWLALAGAIAILLLLGMNNTKEPTAISTEEEMRMEQLISSIAGIKSANVMIAYDAQDKRVGAAVIARGRDDFYTFLEIQRTVQALTELELDRIEIVLSKQ